MRELRRGGVTVPVLLLTARGELDDRVTGLEAGADDYLPKPFAMAELLARVRAMLRRREGYAGDVLGFGGLRLDCSSRELSSGGASVRVNNKEFQLMECFLRHPRQIFSTEELMSRFWSWDSDAEIAVVTGKDAEALCRRAQASGDDAGFIAQYRFRRFEGENGGFFVFLDCDRQLRAAQSLRRVSLLVTLAALCCTFALVWLLSGAAIRPTWQAIERQKRFVTDASHELKTPLTVIRSCADLLCMEDGENEWARGIQRESGRMSRLVSDFVLLSRWDEEPPITEKQSFDLSRSLWDTLAPCQHLAEAEGRRIDADVAENLTLTGDEGALQTAVATLLENAVKYSLPESAISFSARREKRHAALRLANRCDLPEGLDPNRLFDRFYRADPSRSRDSGGNGVGLSIAKAIIEAHGGRIKAERGKEQTIRFSISLPMI